MYFLAIVALIEILANQKLRFVNLFVWKVDHIPTNPTMIWCKNIRYGFHLDSSALCKVLMLASQ